MPRFFWVLMGVIIIVPLVFVFISARKQIGTKAAMRRFLIVLPIVFGTVVVGGVGVFLLSRTLGEDWFVTFQLGFTLFFLPFILWTWWQWRRTEAQAGAVLVDLGRLNQASMRWGRWFVIVGFGGVLITSLIGIRTSGVNIEDVARLLFFATLLGSNLLQPSAERQVREHGLLVGSALIRWEKIKSYRWETDKPNVLTLELHKSNRWWGPPTIPIPPTYRDQVDTLFAHYVARRPHEQ